MKKRFFVVSLFMIMILSISCGGIELKYTKKKITLQDIDYGFNVKHADLGGQIGKIAYIDEGSGDKTLLFIHGIGNYAKYFYYQIKHFMKKYRVIAIDMPGYGKSSIIPETRYSMPFHISAVRKFIKKLNLKNLVIIGHSYGGGVAVGTSYYNKKIVKNAVFIAPLGLQKFNRATIDYVKQNYQSLVAQRTKVNYNLDDFINKWHEQYITRRTKITDDFLREYLNIIYSREIDKIAGTKNKVIRTGMKNTANFQLRTMFKRMPFPVLIISGDNDKAIPMREAPQWTQENPESFWRKIAGLNPKAKYKIIKNCGHIPVIEAPDTLNEIIEKFLVNN